MEDTCVYESCGFAKSLFDKKEQCPNYVESWWTPAPTAGTEGGKPKLVRDCAQKRIFLMVQELYNRLIGVQQAVEQTRNEIVWTETVAMILGKNSGIDLEKLVEERNRMIRMKDLAKVLPQNSPDDALLLNGTGSQEHKEE